MKYLLLITCLAVLTACNNQKGEIRGIAENYVKTSVGKVLGDLEITECAEYNIKLRKGAVEKMKIINGSKKALLDYKESIFKLMRYGLEYTEDEYKKELIQNDIHLSGIEALEKADAEEGYYLVTVCAKVDGDVNNFFSVVMSKDLKVLNKEIDLIKIDSITKRVYEMR